MIQALIDKSGIRASLIAARYESYSVHPDFTAGLQVEGLVIPATSTVSLVKHSMPQEGIPNSSKWGHDA